MNELGRQDSLRTQWENGTRLHVVSLAVAVAARQLKVGCKENGGLLMVAEKTGVAALATPRTNWNESKGVEGPQNWQKQTQSKETVALTETLWLVPSPPGVPGKQGRWLHTHLPSLQGQRLGWVLSVVQQQKNPEAKAIGFNEAPPKMCYEILWL